jgi:hypothetical protein
MFIEDMLFFQSLYPEYDGPIRFMNLDLNLEDIELFKLQLPDEVQLF